MQRLTPAELAMFRKEAKLIYSGPDSGAVVVGHTGKEGWLLAMPLLAVRQGLRTEALSLGWMVVEAAIAIGVGIASRSLALQAFGVDSVTNW